MQWSDACGTGYEPPGIALNHLQTLSRSDMRWGRLTYAQLIDEEFLAKQLRRLDCTQEARRSGRLALLETKEMSLDKSIRQRLMAAQLKASRDASDDDEVEAKVETTDLFNTFHGGKKRELLIAQCVLGNLQQPELATLMTTKLKEALSRLCTFPNPIYRLIFLRRQLIKSMHEATAFQHRQWKATMEKNVHLVRCMEMSLHPSADEIQIGSTDSTGMIGTIKHKAKVFREAIIGLQMMLCILDGYNDSTVTTGTQKREFLANLLLMLHEIAPLALCTRRGNSSSYNFNLPRSSSTSNAATIAEFIEKVQKFLILMCPRPNTLSLTSPRLRAISKTSESEVLDRTNAIDGLIHLAAATGSVRDFLVVLKVLLGATNSVLDAGRSESHITLSSRALYTASNPSLPSMYTSEVLSPDIDNHLTKSKRSRPNSCKVANGHLLSAREIKDDTLLDASRKKGLLKGIKVEAPNISVSKENIATLPSGVSHHRPLYTSRGKNFVSKCFPTKIELKDAMKLGNFSPSVDVPAMKETLVRDSPMCTPIGIARCPKIKNLNVRSVLIGLDGVKPCCPKQASHGNSQSYNFCNVITGPNTLEEDERDREVWSCGQNSYGELGHGDTTSRKSFQRIQSLQHKEIIQIGAGNEHTIALTVDGRVFTCGYNDNGQCGQGVTSRVAVWSEIHELGAINITQAHAYNGCEHTIFVTLDGQVVTCGYNYRGQLGHGNTASESVPKVIQSLDNKIVRLVSCSYYHTILTCEGGDNGQPFVFTFGRNDYGQLGHNDTIDRKIPQRIEALNDEQIVSVACGQYHTMVVTAGGKLFAFGKNDYGQLGVDSFENQVVPVQVKAGLENQECLEVRCGYYHTIVRCTGAHLYAFGRNDYGQLGLGRPNARASAILQLQQQRFSYANLIEELEGKEIIRFACGCYHTIAVSDNGVLYVFGRNNHGQLGTGDTTERMYPFPIDDFAGKRVAQVAAGFYHTVLLTGGIEDEKMEQELVRNITGDTSSTLGCKGIDHLTILSSPTIENWLDPSKKSENKSVGTLDVEKGEAFDNDTRDEDHQSPGQSDAETLIELFSDDALLVGLVILAQLDRLCQPFLPKPGSYPMLQHPSLSVIEKLIKAKGPSFDTSYVFEESFEVFGIHTCSSTFESLAILLKHISTRKIGKSSRFALAIKPISTSHLQAYMLAALIRILQANLSQLLRSSLAKTTMLLSTEMSSPKEPTIDVKGWVNELDQTRLAILQIRDVLFSLVDIRRRRNVCYALDGIADEEGNTLRIAEEAIATLMEGYEIFFPCKCLRRQFFFHVMQENMNRDGSKYLCGLQCRSDLWQIEMFPKSRKLLLEPLLNRMTEDALIVRCLPLQSQLEPSQTSLMHEMYQTVFNRIATEFSQRLGNVVGLQSSSKISPRPKSAQAFFRMLQGMQKHLASWAASVQDWIIEDSVSEQSSAYIESKVAYLIDRTFRVDKNDLCHVPAQWRCFLEFTLMALQQCSEVLRQILSMKSLPSPTRGYTYSAELDSEKRLKIFETVELSVVGQLLPLLVVHLLGFSNNTLFATALLPTLKTLLKFIDAFNQLDPAAESAETQYVEMMASCASFKSSEEEAIVLETTRRESECTFNPSQDIKSISSTGMTSSNVMALPWNFRLEKEVAILTTEMAMTLVVGNPIFTYSNVTSDHDKSSTQQVSNRWTNSSLLQGGLKPNIVAQSINRRSFNSRIVQHTPFPTPESSPFSLILPPTLDDERVLPLWQVPTNQNYREIFGSLSIETFLMSFHYQRDFETQNEAIAAATTLCTWIRDNYCKKDPSYRMLVRQSQLAINSNAILQSVEIQKNDLRIEAACFAALIHHSLVGVHAYHFALMLQQSAEERRSAPPRTFIFLWQTVAQLRRNLAAQKTKIKNNFHLDSDTSQERSFDRIVALQQTILDRCKLLLLLDVYEEQEHCNVQLDAGYIAPYDPAFLVFVDSTCKFTASSAKRHLYTTYTDENLPFLIAFPLSKWRILRTAFHSILRWKFTCRVSLRQVSQEILAFILSDEPVSSLNAISKLLIDPCRRVSCSTRGLENLQDLITMVSYDSIQADIVHQISQVFVLQSSTLSILTRSYAVGYFYLSLQNETFANLFGKLTEIMTDKAARLVNSKDSSTKSTILTLTLFLSAWGIHFDRKQFESVSDIGVLNVIQELMQNLTNRDEGNSCSEMLSSGEGFVNKRVQQTSRSNYFSQNQLARLRNTLWIVFRNICIHFAVQTKTSLNSQDIDVPTLPVCSSVVQLLLDEAVSISNHFLDFYRIKQIELTSSVPVAARRSFEVISQPRRFSCKNKGIIVSYDDMISSSRSDLNPPMSPLLKSSEFSVTTWLYINTELNRRTNCHELPDDFHDHQLVFLRGAGREIALYLVLVPESVDNWRIEVGITMHINQDSEVGSFAGKCRMLERVVSKQVVASGTWSHVAIVLETTKIHLYLNGILDCQCSLAAQNSLIWATGSVNLPLHFGRFPSVFSMDRLAHSVSSAIQFLPCSLGISNAAGWELTTTLSNNAIEHKTKMLRCFDGWLSHFRFHNRSLSPIHVRVVFDEKKLATIVSSDGTQHLRIMELHALIMLLSSSSEGLVHFSSQFSKWVQLIWRTFLESNLVCIQQSSLRVLGALLPLGDPMKASNVLVHDDPMTLDNFGFYTYDNLFVQQIIRMIGFCLYKCPYRIAGEFDSNTTVVPSSLMIARNIHINQFSLDIHDNLHQKTELQSNIEDQYQSSRRQSSVLANELNYLLQKLFKCSNASWSQGIIRTISHSTQHCLSFQTKLIPSEDRFLQFGKHNLHFSTLKYVESVGCSYYLNGGAEFLRPGLTVELRGSRDRAHVVSLVSLPDTNNLPHSLAYVQKDHGPAHKTWSNLSWYDKVFSPSCNVQLSKVNIDELNPTQVTGAHQTYSTVIYDVASHPKGGRVLQTLVEKAAKVIPVVYNTKGNVQSQGNGSKDSFNSVRNGAMLLKALVQVAATEAGVDHLLAEPALLEFITELAVREDKNIEHLTLYQTEMCVNALRHEVYTALIELEEEGEAELASTANCENDSSEVGLSERTTLGRNVWEEEQVIETSRYRESPSFCLKLYNSEEVDREENRRADETWDQLDANEEEYEDEDEDEIFDGTDGENDEEDEDESQFELVEELMLMGFPEDWCILALKQTENDIVNASAWIVDNLEYLSKLQSTLDKEKNRNQGKFRCDEEEDDVVPYDDRLSGQPQLQSLETSIQSATKNDDIESGSKFTSQALSLQQSFNVPILNDKEMGRKVFGEMYFPFEEGGFLFNAKSRFMRSWRAGSIELKETLMVNSSPHISNRAEASSASFEENFDTEIRHLDLKHLGMKLWTLENTLSLMYARRCIVTFLHNLITSQRGISSMQTWISCEQWLKLLKLVLLRGDQFTIDSKRTRYPLELSIDQVFSKAFQYFVDQDLATTAAAAFKFCLEQLEAAAMEKVYEATLWTQRSLIRSDQKVGQEPAIELVVWLLDLLLASPNFIVISLPLDFLKGVMHQLRCCLGTTNLPTKFIVLRTISRLIRIMDTGKHDIVQDSQLVVKDFIAAANLRHNRELGQGRLVFSQYLQSYIELLCVLKGFMNDFHATSAKDVLDTKAQSLVSFQSLSTPQSDGISLQFNRKRSCSSLLTIAEDDQSAIYHGNEVWNTACSTIGFSTGIHSWLVSIDKSNSPYLFVGVAARQSNMDSYLGADDQSWGFIGDKALYYQRNRLRAYGESFKEGDCIGVRLDCEKGELSFSKNGEDLGLAFENVVGEICPAVAFFSRHQKVSFIKNSCVSSGGNEAWISSTGEEEHGSIHDCLTACELMSNWVKKTSMCSTLAAAAFAMTTDWLRGTKKFVTTRSGKSLWVDVTRESCEKLGFYSGDRVRTPRGNAIVLGVANDRLWVDVDTESGSWFFHPSKLHKLTSAKTTLLDSIELVNSDISNPALESDPYLKRDEKECKLDVDDSTLETPMRHLIITQQELTEFGEHSLWTVAVDRELIAVVNDFCETSRINPWNLTPFQLLNVVCGKTAVLELTSVAAVLAMPREICEKMIIARFAILRYANVYISRALPFFDLTWHYFLPDSNSLPCQLISQCRGSIFVSVKNTFWSSLMDRTALSLKRSDDEYDYPDDLPQLHVNRMKAAAAKCHQRDESSLFSSLFGQSFEELHFLPVQTLRMVYSHPMDDGQFRTFKVRFEGEGVDDYGGPYREFFSQFFAELQMLYGLESGNNTKLTTNDTHGEEPSGSSAKFDAGGSVSACLLPFFLPSPNWRNSVGANREKFVLNSALLKDIAEEGGSSKEKRELYCEMFHFLGQMIGICLRTRVCVRLDFAMSVWKQLVAEDDLSLESALETLKEIDYVAYSLWKTLQGILDDSKGQNMAKHMEQLQAMDLVFTTVLSDGQTVELCEDGINTSVTMSNLKDYINLMLQARLQESRDVINIIKQGLHSIMPVSALSLLTWTEFEKRMCGVSEIDVKLLKDNTEYDEELSVNDEFIQRFWRVLESFELEDKRAFLRFVWARSRLPSGSEQFQQKFKIQALASSGSDGNSASSTAGTSEQWMDSQMPKSHTCFFALQLPRYSSDEVCRERFLYAVHNCVEMDGDFRLADTEITGWTDINPTDQLRI
ncbi:hect e3 ubiquitin [Plasmopara halstedii]|uniref:Hect e3 ubiquitin n=1 Tax=Plasmopara halstedii TaxID=4781 RepID=A0A0P1A797_PLAHL|nr:hect e3 ubiquitin [Plasmopara halstedii]CEG36120.1 hect e3 ubiquitin [Plasmopara halstedii]|eukprot:XP_024572489.1 hect e3 ubiquitin [Plasmopara halstedii]